MLGDSALLGTGGGGGGGNSGDAVAATVSAAAASAVAVAGSAHENGADTALGGDGGGGGGGSISGDDDRGRGEEGDRSFGGSRWPRQETLALLKIRSDMDVAFRGSTVKGPLWEEVSRKLAELGYHRNSKKCKEKFENVYKYHRRTKEGRSGKSYGKTYRFFDQLQALEGNNHTAKTTNQSPIPSKPTQTTVPLQVAPVSIVVTASSLPHQIPATTTTTIPMFAASNTTNNLNSVSVPFSHATNVPPTTLPISFPQPILNTTIATTPSINHTIPYFPPPKNPTHFKPSSITNPTSNPSHVNNSNPISFPNIPMDLLPNSSSSSTSSDETFQERRKRKRKLNDFFERIMKEVIEKQEELQRRFLEAIEKREQEWAAREDAWRMQEMQRLGSEREILAQERSMAAAKDAALITFFQKIAEQQNIGHAFNNVTIPSQQHAPPATTPAAVPAPTLVQQPTQIPMDAPVPAPAQTLMQPMELVVLAPQQHEREQQNQVSNIEIVKTNNGDNMMRTSSPRWPKVEILALIKLRTSMDDKYQENGPKGALWEEISSLMRKHGYNRSPKRCKEKWENINKYYKKVKESNKKRPEDSKTCPYYHELDALYRERRNLQNSMNHDSMMPLLMVQPEQQWPPQQPPPSALPDMTMEDAQNGPLNNQHHNDEDKNMDDDEGEEDDEGDKYEIVASKSDLVGASAE